MIVIVDTRYILYRSHFKMGNLTYEGLPTGAIFGLTRTLRSFRNKYGDDTKFILAHDCGVPQFRKDLTNNEYKGNRSVDDEVRKALSFQEGVLLQHLPVAQWIIKDTEADDLIASFCKHYKTSSNICIISNDKDYIKR